jgi:DNA invertase Pin-like site-specific DNA recombinase
MIRAYLRASTKEQDATRARDSLEAFAKEHGQPVAAWYIENESGATTERPELSRLLSDALDGDVLLVESVDRLSRLKLEGWEMVRAQVDGKRLRIVSLDLPTTHSAMTETATDDLTGRILDSVNRLMVDMMAAMARHDYEMRRARQRQGIQKAKGLGKYRGKPVNHELHRKIIEVSRKGFSVRATADLVGCSPTTVQRARAQMS